MIKLMHYNETEKRAHDPQIVTLKETSNWATVDLATAKHPIKDFRQSRRWIARPDPPPCN